MGKLGLVLAEGRSPRLVVDSSISMVTANTAISNRMLLPKVSDLCQAAPLRPALALENVLLLALDVSKAHRRILIHPDDRGLLCFHAGEDLYQSVTLNFGARASGWYWGRVAGLMVRLVHHLLPPTHGVFQYVDDMLLWLDACTAPIWASMVTLIFLCLRIPMSWKKAQMGFQVIWIGWSISTRTWTISIPSDKVAKITDQVSEALQSPKISIKVLQSLVGRLLWVISAWKHLRPLLIPLYKDVAAVPVSQVGMDPVHFHTFVAGLSDELVLLSSMVHLHHSLAAGVKLVRVANQFVKPKSDLHLVYIKSRRVWVGIQDPTNPNRVLSTCFKHTLQTWKALFLATDFSLSMRPPLPVQVSATADAMADEQTAGLGGAVFLPDGRCGWFQFRIGLAEVADVWPWISSSMQKRIACWELLAQFVLSWMIDEMLPSTRGPVSVPQGTDNSATDASVSKGLTMNGPMSDILGPYFLFMRRRCYYPTSPTSLEG